MAPKRRSPDPLPDLRLPRDYGEALGWFVENIHDAAELFETDKERGKQAAAEAAGFLVLGLFRHNRRLRLPFIEIAQELHVRTSGMRQPWLLAEAKALAAASLDMLMELGEQEDTAARQIARAAKRAGLSFGRITTDDWQAIVNLRSDLLRRKGNPKLVQFFEQRRIRNLEKVMEFNMTDEQRKEVVLGLFEREAREALQGLVPAKGD